MLCLGHTDNFKNSFEGVEDIDPKRAPFALFAGLFAYGGWQYIVLITEEIIKPARNVVLSVIISFTLITVLYIGTNVAYFTVLTPQELLSSPAVAISFGTKVFGPSMAWLMSLFVALSCAGSLLVSVLTNSRMIFVSAREGYFPSILAMINPERLTPMPAIISLILIASVYLTFDVDKLLGMFMTVDWLLIALVCSIIPYYRWKKPNMKRPVKFPIWVSIVFILVCLYMVILAIYADPLNSCLGLLITLCSIPVYLFFIWKNKPHWMVSLNESATTFLQKMMVVVPQEKPTWE
ncbi:large neutral amino acids transporter small subunit 1-like [Glandiceps talaboti]